MASGYRMVDHYFGKGNAGFPVTSGTHPWRFCGLQSAVQGREGHAELLGALRRSDKLFFKWFPSPKWMTRLVAALVVLLFAAAVFGAHAIGGWTAVLILLGAVLVGGVLLAIPDDGPLVYSVSLLAKVPWGSSARSSRPRSHGHTCGRSTACT